MARRLIITLICAIAMVAGGPSARTAESLRAPGGGTVRALVVGVDAYPRLGAAAQLKGAAADAKDIARALTNAGVVTAPILDADATRVRFVSEMDRLVSVSKAGDFVIIGFAGHGMQVPEYPQWKGIEPNGVNEQIVFSGYSFSGEGAREIVVNKELRAWLARLDAKGVDVLVVMDSCFGGGMTRAWDSRVGRAGIRSISGDSAESDRDKFAPIQMTEKEARAEIRAMAHVTFLAGATTNSVTPETSGLDPTAPMTMRGALSYFVARAIEGAASSGRNLTREQLFRYAAQNVRQTTAERQIIDFEPRVADPVALQRIVLHAGAIGPTPSIIEPAAATENSTPLKENPVRVAVLNGSASELGAIERGRAPFAEAEKIADADLIWDAAKREALTHGDVVMHGVDASLFGGVIDRTWAIRAVQQLSASRILALRLRQEGKRYVPGENPEIIANDVGDRHLTVFNIAADGEIQMLFPTGGRHSRMSADEWTYRPIVEKPFGADCVVAVSTQRPAADFIPWLIEHNHRRDAALIPDQLARLVGSDSTARIGLVGLYTSAARD